MNLKGLRVKNFRRLRDVSIDLEKETSIFVGANNSGKTSAAHLLSMFFGSDKPRFTIHDLSSCCWEKINSAPDVEDPIEQFASIPSISLDLWITVEESELFKVVDLLPRLEWEGLPVGIRIEYSPKSPSDLIENYRIAKSKTDGTETEDYQPWPQNVTDYLDKRLNSEYEVRYYVLDRSQFDNDLREIEGASSPRLIPKTQTSSGSKVLNSLIKFDFLRAQRHLSDDSAGRSENLSRRLNRYYQRNLEKRDNDLDAMKALASSEAALSTHLESVFSPMLRKLNDLGYPGFADPRMIVKAAFSEEHLVSQNAELHYAVTDNEASIQLPDKYNGLGFKNLIYMVIELLDFHANWLSEEAEKRAPLHLIVIEEPEVHLHTQLQQVFISKVLDLLKIESDDLQGLTSQLIVTTHSPHIIYEKGFRDIRYFKRKSSPELGQTTEVLNLSTFYDSDEEDRGFLERYMKITHCDLFFADAAILVEGNVERLLLPIMIQKCAPSLKSCYLSILEVGGAYAYRFRKLIEFLELTTLIVTDLDSVFPRQENAEEDNEADDEEDGNTSGSTCMTTEDGAVTCNQTLIQWLPKKNTIAELITASNDDKTQMSESGEKELVRVAYQTRRTVTWNAASGEHVGRTLEEDFGLENAAWLQNDEQKHLGLKVRGAAGIDLTTMAEKLFRKVKSSSFKKTDFALGLISESPESWNAPPYIEEGLIWLDQATASLRPGELGDEGGPVD